MNEKAIYIILNEKLKQMEEWRMPNIVVMLGMMVGTKLDERCVGPDLVDASGITHAGIGNVVMPILSIKEADVRNFYSRSKDLEKTNDIKVFDFVLCAQNSKVYSDYQEKLSRETLDDQDILGIAIYGDKKPVVSLCGSLARWK